MDDQAVMGMLGHLVNAQGDHPADASFAERFAGEPQRPKTIGDILAQIDGLGVMGERRSAKPAAFGFGMAPKMLMQPAAVPLDGPEEAQDAAVAAADRTRRSVRSPRNPGPISFGLQALGLSPEILARIIGATVGGAYGKMRGE